MSLMSQGLLQSVERNTSPVDWCEENYLFSPRIAEFYNTFSNALFFVMPPILMHLFKDYARHVHCGIHLVWLLLIIVGVCSAYFHATLSLLGQLLDELSILWVYTSTMIFFCPRRYFPKIIRKNFAWLMLTFSIGATFASVWNPIVNAFALMCLVIPTFWLLFKELDRIKQKGNVDSQKVYELGVRTVIILAFAIVTWVNDRAFCNFYTQIRVTYLHAVWHVLIFLSSYTLCVLFAYFFVESEKPNTQFKLSYWPRNELNFTGIPYIEIKHPKTLSD